MRRSTSSPIRRTGMRSSFGGTCRSTGPDAGRRHARRRHGRRFSPEVNILASVPTSLRERKQFGHWECDLMQFRKKFGKANVTSLVERVSRFAVFLRNNDRQSKPIMDGLIQALQSLPHLARRSITFDRGTEFTDWPYLQAGIGTQTWFCDPQSPWQKGTVENTNRRARKWLSREVDPLSLSDRDLTEICNRLNATPRKCLGYKTPAEVFRQKTARDRHDECASFPMLASRASARTHTGCKRKVKMSCFCKVEMSLCHLLVHRNEIREADFGMDFNERARAASH